jgi:hypothetical protein
MGRKPLPAALRKKQFNVALDDDTRASLEKIATEHGQTVADEIRQRLDRTLLEDEKFDELTRHLGSTVMDLAASIQRHGAKGVAWHQHPKAFEALTQAIMTWLEGQKPPEADPDLFGPDDPLTLGRSIALALLFQARGSEELYRRVGRGVRKVSEGFTGIADKMKASRQAREAKKKK